MILRSGYYQGERFVEPMRCEANSVTVEDCTFENGLIIDARCLHVVRRCRIHQGVMPYALLVNNANSHQRYGDLAVVADSVIGG